MSDKNVLLVDDNPADLMLAETVLEDHGFTVISAGSGAEALEVVTQFTFGLIVIDMQMPEMSGLQLLEKLMKNSDMQDVPKLMLSASSNIADVKKAIQIGAHDYLTKPIDVMLLEEKLKALSGAAGDWKEFDVSEEYAPNLGLLAACQLKTLSELSGSIETSFPLRVGSVTTVHLKIHGWFDAGLVNARVNSVEKQEGERTSYLVQVGFVGLTETAKGEIRKFCNKLYVDKKNKERDADKPDEGVA